MKLLSFIFSLINYLEKLDESNYYKLFKLDVFSNKETDFLFYFLSDMIKKKLKFEKFLINEIINKFNNVFQKLHLFTIIKLKIKNIIFLETFQLQ